MRCSHLESGTIPKHADLTLKVVPPEQNPTRYKEGLAVELCVFCSGYVRGATSNLIEGRRLAITGRYTRKELHALIEGAARILRKNGPTTRSESDPLSTLELLLLSYDELHHAESSP